MPLPPTRCGGHLLEWGRKTYVMAILNITPDSFSGDGLLGAAEEQIVARAVAAQTDGADILDIGAESTRPGHEPVDTDEELARVIPVIRAIAPHVSIPISIDTYKAAVAGAALASGATIVNDIRGLTGDIDMAMVVALSGVPVIIMHDRPPDGRGDVVTSVVRELARRIDHALVAGVAWEQIIIDPGFGFGKEWRENLVILRRLGELRALGRPILSGTSRKRTIGHVLGLPAEERVEGTAATVAISIANGADIVRVHDVREMSRVAKMTDAIVRGTP
jgi:dihydropteroate synthase